MRVIDVLFSDCLYTIEMPYYDKIESKNNCTTRNIAVGLRTENSIMNNIIQEIMVQQQQRQQQQ